MPSVVIGETREGYLFTARKASVDEIIDGVGLSLPKSTSTLSQFPANKFSLRRHIRIELGENGTVSDLCTYTYKPGAMSQTNPKAVIFAGVLWRVGEAIEGEIVDESEYRVASPIVRKADEILSQAAGRPISFAERSMAGLSGTHSQPAAHPQG